MSSVVVVVLEVVDVELVVELDVVVELEVVAGGSGGSVVVASSGGSVINGLGNRGGTLGGAAGGGDVEGSGGSGSSAGVDIVAVGSGAGEDAASAPTIRRQTQRPPVGWSCGPVTATTLVAPRDLGATSQASRAPQGSASRRSYRRPDR